MNMVTQAFVTSPYFGEFPTGGIGVMDQAYEAYAKRMGFDPSSSFTDPRDEATQADPRMARSYTSCC